MSPLRDYKCRHCGFIVEKYFHKESEMELPDRCPGCDKPCNFRQMPPMVAPGRVKDGTPKFYPSK